MKSHSKQIRFYYKNGKLISVQDAGQARSIFRAP